MMNRQKQDQLYANLMHEVKLRIEVIKLSLEGHTRLSDPFVREICWLQLRMLCELVALSCIVAHGDIAFLQSHKVGKATSAEDIMNRMTKLRPHFFPFACSQEVVTHPGGSRGFNMTVIKPPPLTKDDLLALYGKTHRHVHRGSLKNLLSLDVNAPWDQTIDAPEIAGWAQRLNGLLSNHAIAIDSDNLILCILRNADDNNNVQVARAGRQDIAKQQKS